MNLTKEDLQAIDNLIDEKISPLKQAAEVMIKANARLVTDLADVKKVVHLISIRQSIPQESTDLMGVLKDLK